MDKDKILVILETAVDKNGNIPMRIVRQAFEKLPEPCEDAVSRREAIDAIGEVHSLDYNAQAIKSRIEKLPPVQPEQWWIPWEDLISRQAAIGAMAELQGRASTKAELKGISKAWKRIKQLPSAHPEIIRCKDCKWWSNDYRECSSPNYDDGYVTPAGFYCGYAERRTDE